MEVLEDMAANPGILDENVAYCLQDRACTDSSNVPARHCRDEPCIAYIKAAAILGSIYTITDVRSQPENEVVLGMSPTWDVAAQEP